MNDDEASKQLRKLCPWLFPGDGPPGFDQSATYTHLETVEESEARVQQWRRERGLEDPIENAAPLSAEGLREFHTHRTTAELLRKDRERQN